MPFPLNRSTNNHRVMKKALFLATLAILVLSSCQGTLPWTTPTTYTFYDYTSTYADAVRTVEGKGYIVGDAAKGQYAVIKLSYAFVEYAGGQPIAQHTLIVSKNVKSNVYEANERAEYVTVMISLRVETEKQTAGSTWYVANAFYLTPHENTDIVIDDDTILAIREPKL